MTKIDRVVNQVKKRKPEAIFVFGSRVWGKPDEDSDVDVLVVESAKQGHAERMKEIYTMLPDDVAVDLIALDREQLEKSMKVNSFYRQIIEKGKLVYGGL